MFTAASASLNRKKFIKRSGKAQNKKKWYDVELWEK
jgi:hypothetical protein